LANLFTLVENCRQAGIDPEAYLIDLIAHLPDHPARTLRRCRMAVETGARSGSFHHFLGRSS